MSQLTDGSYYHEFKLQFARSENKSAGFVFNCDHGSGSVTFYFYAPKLTTSGTTFYSPDARQDPNSASLVDITEDVSGYSSLPATAGTTDFGVVDTMGKLRLYDTCWVKAVIDTGGVGDANYTIIKRDIPVSG